MANEDYRKTATRWRFATIVCIVIILGLVVYILKSALTDDMEKVKETKSDREANKIDLEEPTRPSIFHDLTRNEISELLKYLYSKTSLNLVSPSEALINTSYLYTAELYLPPKNKVLEYLDKGGQAPNREAIVTIFRGDMKPPYVEEKIVGPLSGPSYMRNVPGRRRKIPYEYRPITAPDMRHMFIKVEYRLHEKAGFLLKESFGGSILDCGDRCLVLRFPVPLSPAVTAKHSRKLWVNMYQYVEYFSLYPVDFAVLMESKMSEVIIHQIWYNGKKFNDIQELIQRYNDGTAPKLQVAFPETNTKSFSTLFPKGQPFQKTFQRQPVEVEPDGKRYSIKHNHAEYRGWDFYFRMSTSIGPQIYNVKFRGERIVYEISLQEILVMYSGHKPSQGFVNYFDGFSPIGLSARSLVPGVDCPEHATFIDNTHFVETSVEPETYKGSFCVFEYIKDLPLRRHHSYSIHYGHFYEGLANNVLVLRSITSIVNYDYIFDFVFYQNGAIQIKALSTGYIMSTTASEQESNYGFRLHNLMSGNIHIHAFNFKVDIDVHGTSNRYETLEIEAHSVPNEYSADTNARYHMTKLTRNLKETELRAAYKFDFDNPKYLIFYNENVNVSEGHPVGYRLLNQGMIKMLYPEGLGNEPSASWSRYQIAVTKRKETERQSSSMYAYMDSIDPVVQFQKYLDDDDSIVDEDIVAWVTLGVHHIPHTEDLPVTTTPGMDLSFYLLPFNYFQEDPAISSQHSVRMDLKNSKSKKDVRFSENFLNLETDYCQHDRSPFKEYLVNDWRRFLEIPED